MDKLAYDLSNLIERFKPSNQQAQAEADQMDKIAGLLESLGLRAPAAPAPSGGGGMGALAPIAALLALAGGAYAFRDKLGLGGGGEDAMGGKDAEPPKGKNPHLKPAGGDKGGLWDLMNHTKGINSPRPSFDPKKHFVPTATKKPDVGMDKKFDRFGNSFYEEGPKADVWKFLQSLLGQ